MGTLILENNELSLASLFNNLSEQERHLAEELILQAEFSEREETRQLKEISKLVERAEFPIVYPDCDRASKFSTNSALFLNFVSGLGNVHMIEFKLVNKIDEFYLPSDFLTKVEFNLNKLEDYLKVWSEKLLALEQKQGLVDKSRSFAQNKQSLKFLIKNEFNSIESDGHTHAAEFISILKDADLSHPGLLIAKNATLNFGNYFSAYFPIVFLSSISELKGLSILNQNNDENNFSKSTIQSNVDIPAIYIQAEMFLKHGLLNEFLMGISDFLPKSEDKIETISSESFKTAKTFSFSKPSIKSKDIQKPIKKIQENAVEKKVSDLEYQAMLERARTIGGIL